MTQSQPDSFFDALCEFTDSIRLLFTLVTAGFVLMLLVLPFVDRQTGAWVISLVNLAFMGVLLLVSGLVLLWCERYSSR